MENDTKKINFMDTDIEENIPDDSLYRSFDNDPNMLSKWYPKIQKCGIPTPKTRVLKVPENIFTAFFLDNREKDRMEIYQWVTDAVQPALREQQFHGPFVFVKNGTYSNKYFGSCISHTDSFSLTQNIIDINYSALMCGANGCTELVLREMIPYKPQVTPCIYHGLPLRSEFRVFYDFDQKKVLYSVNYWDYDYCSDAISRDCTDKIVFDYMREYLEAAYKATHSEIEHLVGEHMANVNLKGQWSIDILLDENGKMWLIDMAVAQQSAYWNPSFLKTNFKEEKICQMYY